MTDVYIDCYNVIASGVVECGEDPFHWKDAQTLNWRDSSTSKIRPIQSLH